MILIIGFASLGAWPASFVVSGETSSLNLRAKTAGIGWLLSNIMRSGFDLGMPYLYNSDAASLNLGGKTGFVFAGTAGLALILSWLIVPELKGRSPVEADRLFEKKVPAWRFTAPEYTSLESTDQLSLNIPKPSTRERSTSQGSYGGSTEYNPYEFGGQRSRAVSGASAFQDFEMGPVDKPPVDQDDMFSPASRRPQPFARRSE